MEKLPTGYASILALGEDKYRESSESSEPFDSIAGGEEITLTVDFSPRPCVICKQPGTDDDMGIELTNDTTGEVIAAGFAHPKCILDVIAT